MKYDEGGGGGCEWEADGGKYSSIFVQMKTKKMLSQDRSRIKNPNLSTESAEEVEVL